MQLQMASCTQTRPQTGCNRDGIARWTALQSHRAQLSRTQRAKTKLCAMSDGLANLKQSNALGKVHPCGRQIKERAYLPAALELWQAVPAGLDSASSATGTAKGADRCTQGKRVSACSLVRSCQSILMRHKCHFGKLGMVSARAD